MSDEARRCGRNDAARSRRVLDRPALALTVAVHLALLLLLLRAHATVRRPYEPVRALAVFDLAPPLPVSPPPPAPRPRPSDRSIGGSGTRHLPRTRPSTPRAARAAPLPAAPSPPVLALTPPSSFDDGRGIVAVAGGDAGGDGDVGTGAGSGSGAGDGTGSGPGAPRYARAEWIRMPTNAEMNRYLPAALRGHRLAGRVELGCILPRPGKPKRCWVLSERPRGLGLGRAAVAMSGVFRIRPVLRNDAVFDLPVIVPIDFQTLPAPASAATASPAVRVR